MSLSFSDTSTYRGIVQIYEKEAGFNLGDISGSATKLKEFTADANLALDDFFAIAFQSSGTWQFDDSNHTAYPFITTNLVSGQRDYSFTTDQQGNIILDIYKVMVANADGVFSEIYPVDQQTMNSNQGNLDTFINGQNSSGAPTRYDKTANGIFLDLIPNYNYTNGLKVFINREASYFVSGDTTKIPGVPGLFHKYFALKPAMDYARRKNLPQYKTLAIEVANMEKSIRENFGKRQRDLKGRLQVNLENNH